MNINRQDENIRISLRIDSQEESIRFYCRIENIGDKRIFLIGRGSELVYCEQGVYTNRFRAGTNIKRELRNQHILYVFNNVEYAMGTMHIPGLGWLFDRKLEPGRSLETVCEIESGPVGIECVDIHIDYLVADQSPDFVLMRQKVGSLRTTLTSVDFPSADR